MRANGRYKSFGSAGSAAIGLALLCSVSSLIAQQTAPAGASGTLRTALANGEQKALNLTIR